MPLLNDRAQARRTVDVVRDSGTGDAIPRCLQRFVLSGRTQSTETSISDIAPIKSRSRNTSCQGYGRSYEPAR